MKNIRQLLSISVFLLLITPKSGQGQSNEIISVDEAGIYKANENYPCISDSQYLEIEREITRNRNLLSINKNVPDKNQGTVLLQWPLEPSPSLTDCDYYYISAYVDQNTTSGAIQDWNCGTRTYDGHRGVDIVPWPFIWNKMDSNLVRVIAAAPGTIIAKVDGNPDRVCNGVGGGSTSNNYITIQHADNSTALYIHMKSGSLTAKTVGQQVAVGEYLGIVGSAGQSTGVHLHFEIRSDGTFANYVDPYDGTCNSVASSSWWASQKPYDEPSLLKLSVHNSWPYMGVCPNTVDSTYEVSSFISNPGAQATFYACSRDVAAGAIWDFKILDPNNVVVDSWNYTNNNTPRRTSSLGWNKTLPVIPGTYTFQGTFNGMSCSKTFDILTTTSNETENSPYFNPYIYPNPVASILTIKCDKSLSGKKFAINDMLGQQVMTGELINEVSSIDISQLIPGIYFLRISEDKIIKIFKN